MYPTCVICIGLVLFVSVFWVIVVFVIYIFCIITTCNVPIITACNVIYIHYICIKKQRKQEQKKCHFAECKSQCTRQSNHKGSPGNPLCRELKPKHSVNIQTLPSARGWALGKDLNFAECLFQTLDKVSNLCRVPPGRHSAKFESLPTSDR